MPVTLAPHIRAVLGIDDVSRLSAAHSSPVDIMQSPSIENNLPTTVAFTYYQYPKNVTGRGATVAFIESTLEINLGHIQEFFDYLNVGPVSIVVEKSPLQATSPPDFLPTPPMDGEAMMDLQLTGAVAPDATLVVYGINQGYGYCSDPWIDALLAAIENQKYPCNVMSISLGAPESTWGEQVIHSINLLFAIAGILGITVCVASGDYGAPGEAEGKYLQNCAFPASSPFCLACGGTELLLDTSSNGVPTLTGEIVWNGITAKQAKAASGGGISMMFPVPEFQSTLTLPAALNKGQVSGRGVPDVASNASGLSGYGLYPDGTGDGYGTSAAAPMWAALIGLLIEDNATSIGFLNPYLYALQLGGKFCCTPILVGDNGPEESPISFNAGSPWNACCGLGSPLGTNLAVALKATESS